jgi:hypothetical protein
MAAEVREGERLEAPKTPSMEENQNRPHFTDAPRGLSEAVLLSLGALRGLEMRNELPTELVTVIAEAQDVHGACL